MVSGHGRDPASLATAAREAASVLDEDGCTRVATIVNRAHPGAVDDALDAPRLKPTANQGSGVPVYVLPETSVLSALTVNAVVSTVLFGHGRSPASFRSIA